jgi:hypothetical protein
LNQTGGLLTSEVPWLVAFDFSRSRDGQRPHIYCDASRDETELLRAPGMLPADLNVTLQAVRR